mmetsp:Transcript_11349/g.21770  ORF Transcript_11349/g.21770 Transcript_11349/m.21770 type:complete len:196 (-) Transcript_11349:260-847(-)
MAGRNNGNPLRDDGRRTLMFLLRLPDFPSCHPLVRTFPSSIVFSLATRPHTSLPQQVSRCSVAIGSHARRSGRAGATVVPAHGGNASQRRPQARTMQGLATLWSEGLGCIGLLRKWIRRGLQRSSFGIKAAEAGRKTRSKVIPNSIRKAHSVQRRGGEKDGLGSEREHEEVESLFDRALTFGRFCARPLRTKIES